MISLKNATLDGYPHYPPMVKLFTLQDVVTALTHHQIGAFPCDTIWGIIGNPTTSHRIAKLKKRPRTQPFITLVPDLTCAQKLTQPWTDEQAYWISQCWPGPITLILPAPNETIALRLPGPSLIQSLLQTIAAPILSTSLNLTGQPAMSGDQPLPEALENELDFIYIHPTPLSNPASLIVSLVTSPPQLIRSGALPQ